MDSPFNQEMPQIQEERANIIAQINPEIDVESLEHELRGEKFNRKSLDWVSSKIALINEKGLTILISMIKSQINLTATLSNLTPHEISRKVLSFGKLVNKITTVNRKAWAIERSARAGIVFSFCNLLDNTLKRCVTTRDDKILTDKEVIRDITHQHTTISQQPEPKQRSKLFQMFK